MCEVAKIKTQKSSAKENVRTGFIDVLALNQEKIIIGKASLSKHKTDKSFLWLHELEVHPLCRRQGIGTILMDHVADVARKEKVDMVYLHPAPLEHTEGKQVSPRKLQQFYREQGYKPCPAPKDAVTVTDEGLLKRGMCLAIKK